MTGDPPAAPTLAAGLSLAAASMLLTHPLAVAALLAASLAFAHATGALDRSPFLVRIALGLGVAVVAFNALFSWNGATVLYEAPLRITWLGRPRFTLEAIAWGAVAGTQLASTTLALGSATLTVPPEALHEALVRVGAPKRLATAGALALRLVPDTTRDAGAMRRALRTRGLDTDGLRGLSHVLVPLTARSLDRSLVAEEALTMRGYDPERGARGRLPPVAWAALATIFLAGAIALLGPGRPDYYPLVAAPLDPVSLGLVALAVTGPILLVREVRASSS